MVTAMRGLGHLLATAGPSVIGWEWTTWVEWGETGSSGSVKSKYRFLDFAVWNQAIILILIFPIKPFIDDWKKRNTNILARFNLHMSLVFYNFPGCVVVAEQIDEDWESQTHKVLCLNLTKQFAKGWTVRSCWSYTHRNSIFIGPRCPWGPIYGSWCI